MNWFDAGYQFTWGAMAAVAVAGLSLAAGIAVAVVGSGVVAGLRDRRQSAKRPK